MPDRIKESRGDASSPAELRLNRYAQPAAVVIVLAVCYLVLQPFIPGILFAAVVCSATWPLYLRLRQALWGRPVLAIGLTLLRLWIARRSGESAVQEAHAAGAPTVVAEGTR